MLFSIFKHYPKLQIFMSTAKDGSMRKSLKRNAFLNKLAINNSRVVYAGLVHADKTTAVDNKHSGKIIKDTDGLITQTKNLYLAVTVADCLPIVIFDAKKNIVCLLHAGWKGLKKDIITKTVVKLKKEYQSQSEDLLAGIGPGIGKCHFEVKKDVSEHFQEYPQAILTKQNKTYIDLHKIAWLKLMAQGILEKHIEINPDCTYCGKNKYFSRRRQKNNFQTMIIVTAVI